MLAMFDLASGGAVNSPAPTNTISWVNRKYDEEMYSPKVRDYYGGTDFYNFGYWKPGIRTQRGV